MLLGNGLSAASLVTLLSLLFLRSRETNRLPDRQEAPVPVAGRLLRVALPLALADDLRMGISTVENLIVPRRLGLFPQSAEPLAEYGVVCGMVFPTLMFPAAILFSLAELLVPELSRCAAGGRRKRIAYLTGRSLRVALLYGLAAGGILFTASEALGMVLFDNPLVGRQLRRFALLAPMLYVDAVTDANVKGMGQQVACVRYNTVTSFLDVVFLWLSEITVDQDAGEALALAQFTQSVMGDGLNILIDTHGWYQQIIPSGDRSGTLFQTFSDYFPGNSYASLRSADGYYSAWAAYTLGYDACLFEFPHVSSAQDFQEKGYGQDYVDAICAILEAYGSDAL